MFKIDRFGIPKLLKFFFKWDIFYSIKEKIIPSRVYLSLKHYYRPCSKHYKKSVVFNFSPKLRNLETTLLNKKMFFFAWDMFCCYLFYLKHFLHFFVKKGIFYLFSETMNFRNHIIKQNMFFYGRNFLFLPFLS